MAIEDLSEYSVNVLEDMIDLTEKRLRRLDNSTASAVYKRDRKKFLINKLTAIQAELLGRVEAYNAKQMQAKMLYCSGSVSSIVVHVPTRTRQ
jgi:hypothetical protein